jgi:predicted PhzF superfamily epimerase YddE/YHI9
MELRIFQVDAFASRVFVGNPAAVMPLEAWLDDATLQSIAVENNLSETAFLVRHGPDYDLRWFTPGFEIDLCGHATLASAFIVFTQLEPLREAVTFHTRSGPLVVTRDGDRLVMDFPSRPPVACDTPEGLVRGLGRAPLQTLRSRDLLAVFEREEDVLALRPDMQAIEALGVVGVIATAPGRDVDFVSRFFAPGAGVPEDPVTGSAHCTLVPYWSQRLGKPKLHARQVSARGGELFCEDRGARVTLAGHAVLFLEGVVRL